MQRKWKKFFQFDNLRVKRVGDGLQFSTDILTLM